MKAILKRFSVTLLFIGFAYGVAEGQSSDLQQSIRSAVENADWTTASSELNKLKAADPNAFQAKGYDYLAARVAEKSGDIATAVAGYQAVASKNTQLTPYALWHLALLARSTGDLLLEREQLRKLTQRDSLPHPLPFHYLVKLTR